MLTTESNAFSFTPADQTALRHIDMYVQCTRTCMSLYNNVCTSRGDLTAHSCNCCSQLQALNHCAEPESLSTGELSQNCSSHEVESQRLMEIDEKLTILHNSDSPPEPQVQYMQCIFSMLSQYLYIFAHT